jgi:hypothetical protein
MTPLFCATCTFTYIFTIIEGNFKQKDDKKYDVVCSMDGIWSSFNVAWLWKRCSLLMDEM